MLADFEVIDLFAGPGGWDVAAHRLGLDPMGIEFDAAACQTRKAAGLATIEGDVRAYGPRDLPRARGVIASPPCQTFSMAGKGAGRKALDHVLELVENMAVGIPPVVEALDDERTGLVLEPLRWALDAMALGRPFEWLAFEQVPTVLPVWQAMAQVLRGGGYRVETGLLHAEQFGVPQTRKRAILVARYGKPVSLPIPTHSRYHVRNKTRLDPGVLPWVSMAEALGWGEATMRSNYGSGGDPGNRGERASEEPAPTVTSKIDRNKWKLMGAGAGHMDGQQPRDDVDPAHTITGKGTAAWVHERPSTTIVGSFKPEIVAAPGYRVSTADGSRQNAPGSVRVSVQEAALLQSFPVDYPWQGSKTKQYQQVGNAIPPRLAEAVLRSVLTPLR